jgi:hypothetical protein
MKFLAYSDIPSKLSPLASVGLEVKSRKLFSNHFQFYAPSISSTAFSTISKLQST